MGIVDTGWVRVINLEAPQICKQGAEIFIVRWVEGIGFVSHPYKPLTDFAQVSFPRPMLPFVG